jgi:hypothetical protein
MNIIDRNVSYLLLFFRNLAHLNKTLNKNGHKGYKYGYIRFLKNHVLYLCQTTA